MFIFFNVFFFLCRLARPNVTLTFACNSILTGHVSMSPVLTFRVAQGAKRWHSAEPPSASSPRTPTWGGGGSSAHLRAHQPAHPFVQDPAMPPLPPPNTLAQLEEACRRLEEVSKPPKQR